MENPQSKKPNKYVVLTTYLIAVVCLLLGLFLPLWGDKGILALQLPDVFNKIANKDIISSVKKEFAVPYPINFFGTGKTVDIMAWVVLLYAVVTVLSLLALIPIGISTKKGTKTASVFMYIIEAAAVIVLSVYVLIALQYQINIDGLPAEFLPPISKICYNMIIALGGPLLMLILLSLLNKKGTGAAKMFLFLLSAVAVISIYDISLIIPKLANIKLVPAIYGDAGVTVSGISHLNLLFENSFAETLKLLPDAKNKALLMLCTITSLVVILNFIVDVIGLSTKAKKTGYVFNIAKYALGLACIIALIITVVVCKYKIGLMLIILTVAVVAQILISIVRLLLFRRKKTNTADEEIDDIEYAEPVRTEPVRNFARPEPVVVETVTAEQQQTYEQPEEPVVAEPRPPRDKYGFNEPAEPEPIQMEIVDVKPEPEHKPVPVQPAPVQPSTVQPVNEPEIQTRIYTINTIYGGPVDEFMKKLTNDERIEFAMTFIEKSKGNIGNIPEYVIGGNNRLFFSSVFIYLGRIRGLISDGLLNKMYKELNML